MNEEQRKKAIQILYLKRIPTFDDARIEKEKAYKIHLWAYMMVEQYNLPYRILLEYFKRYGYEYMKYDDKAHNDSIVLLNRSYPSPGYLKSELPRVNWYIRNYEVNPIVRIEHGPFKDDLTSTAYDIRTFIDDENINAQIDKATNKQHPWNLETDEGLTKWEYEFAHFLADADFSTYKSFDWFGVKTSTPDKSKIRYWKKLQRLYKKNPERYRQEEPPYLNEYADKYTLQRFLWADR